MIAYKVKDEKAVAIECEELAWPKTDADGDTIYVNTHFATRKECLEHAVENYRAGVELITDKVKQLRKETEKAEKQLVNECIALLDFEMELEQKALK